LSRNSNYEAKFDRNAHPDWTHKGGVKQMTDQQIEDAIAAIQGMLEARAGEDAKVVEGEALSALPPPPARR
jgi:hypothetical protein